MAQWVGFLHHHNPPYYTNSSPSSALDFYIRIIQTIITYPKAVGSSPTKSAEFLRGWQPDGLEMARDSFWSGSEKLVEVVGWLGVARKLRGLTAGMTW